VRCVRNFLRINIVAQEELGGNGKAALNSNTGAHSNASANKSDPHALLNNVMKEKGIPFEALKKKLLDEKFKGAAEIEDVAGISKSKVFELIERIKKAK
jgi:hypothetical protein